MFQKMSNKLAVLVGTVVSLVAGVASAVLPTAAGTAITAIETDGLSLVALAWPVLGTITAAFIVLKLFKRAASKV